MPSNAHRRLAWLVGRWWFWTLAVALLFGQPIVRTLLRERPVLPPVGAALPPWTLTRETGAPFGSADLATRVWIAGFLSSSDDALAATLLGVQRRLRHMGDSYRIVTFTTDPERDTPAQLSAFQRARHTNPRAWVLVTGARAALVPLAAALGAPQNGTDLAHPPERLALIDQQGRIRGTYDPHNQADLDTLVATLGLLVNAY